MLKQQQKHLFFSRQLRSNKSERLVNIASRRLRKEDEAEEMVAKLYGIWLVIYLHGRSLLIDV